MTQFAPHFVFRRFAMVLGELFGYSSEKSD
jgi:hypothetical protein